MCLLKLPIQFYPHRFTFFYTIAYLQIIKDFHQPSSVMHPIGYVYSHCLLCIFIRHVPFKHRYMQYTPSVSLTPTACHTIWSHLPTPSFFTPKVYCTPYASLCTPSVRRANRRVMQYISPHVSLAYHRFKCTFGLLLKHFW